MAHTMHVVTKATIYVFYCGELLFYGFVTRFVLGQMRLSFKRNHKLLHIYHKYILYVGRVLYVASLKYNFLIYGKILNTF